MEAISVIASAAGLEVPEVVTSEWMRKVARAVGVEIDGGAAPDLISTARAIARHFETPWEDEHLVHGESLTEAGLRRLALCLDRRVELMEQIWRELGRTSQMPLDHTAFLREVFENEAFYGTTAPTEIEKLARAILRKCEDGRDPDDLEEFVQDGTPTAFFYADILAYVENLEEEPGQEEATRADEEEEEDDGTPIAAEVTAITIETLRAWVKRGTLDLYPPWQRTDVWSAKKKKELIRSILLGIPLPSIILHEKDGLISIIDGKQRLTATIGFMNNNFKLPKYDVPDDHPLSQCSGCWYEAHGKRRKSLPIEMVQKIEVTRIPVLHFKNVPEARLRNIFRLYNVGATKLNAAEIRNAVYQNNPIHRMAFLLAGEKDPLRNVGTEDFELQKKFTRELRATGISQKRYAVLDFLCRYLGYSRATPVPQKDGRLRFTISSTSKTIERYLDHCSEDEDPVDVAKEIIHVFYKTKDFFTIDDDRLAFHRRDAKMKRKFNALVAVTNMVATRLLLDALADSVIDEDEARDLADDITLSVQYPSGQTSATIWDYQARVLLGIIDRLDPAWIDSGRYRDFKQRMQHAVLPDEARDG